jgi:hypothetical protein
MDAAAPSATRAEAAPAASVQPPATATSDDLTFTEGMSRKALKRHAKFLRKKEAYKEKRAMLKEAKRQKREEAGLPDRPQPRQNLDPAAAAEKREAKRRVKAKARDAFRRDSESGPIVVFDMTNEWEKAMTCNERRSLAQQLMYGYGFNKRALRPARLLVTGLPPGSLTEQSLLQKQQCGGGDDGGGGGGAEEGGEPNSSSTTTHTPFCMSPWMAFEISNRPLEDHLPSLRSHGLPLIEGPSEQQQQQQQQQQPVDSATSSLSSSPSSSSSSSSSSSFSSSPNTAPRDIVYLTADARGDKELDELDWSPNTIYVLGGIVDRNRMTNACVRRAERQRKSLPIATHLKQRLNEASISGTNYPTN